MTYFLLFYDVVDRFAEKRRAYRGAHLALVDNAHARGILLFAGAYGDPPCGAALLFRVENIAEIREFAEADPYVSKGLVRRWSVHPWHVVIGEGASR